MKSHQRLLLVCLSATFSACGSNTHSEPTLATENSAAGSAGASDTDGNSAGAAGDDVNNIVNSEPPQVRKSGALCVLSADCPVGTHCDLGECVQECSQQSPCAKGNTCSARARCLSEGEPDKDPVPSQDYVGMVTAEPATALLNDADQELTIKLVSTSKNAVQYRIELDAPHLSIMAYRGEFQGGTTVKLHVDSSKLKGQDTPGSIKIFTSLGNVVVTTPMHSGLTGTYRGVLNYEGGQVSLGHAQVQLDLIEQKGSVLVRFDPSASLLFPETPNGPATGFGNYAPGQPIELNASQVFPADFAGTRNHFARDIGRKLKLTLNADGAGDLNGTFEEKVYGMFGQPVSLTGTVQLSYVPHAPKPRISLSKEVGMPTAPLLPTADAPRTAATLGWGEECSRAGDRGIVYRGCDKSYDSSSLNSRLDCFARLQTRFSEPLYAAMAGASLDFDELAKNCSNGMQAAGFLDTRGQTNCGAIAPLGCALDEISLYTHDLKSEFAFGSLMQRTIAPAVLVAQNEVVDALKDSFTSGGAIAELQRYDAAADAVTPVATWVLQPEILEYLRLLSAKGAASTPTDPAQTTQTDTYPSVRALTQLLNVLTSVDAERTRVSAANEVTAQADRIRQAQERGVMTFFEVAAVAGALNSWGISPPNVASRFIGILSPLDDGFAAVVRGAASFGVPDGFIPFVYSPKNAGPGASTNFGQMQAIARETVDTYVSLEASYTKNSRDFEQNEAALRQELLQISTTYGSRVAEICGTSFNVDAVKTDEDWAKCGTNDEGEVGQLLLQLEGANTKLQDSLGAIQGMRDKIAIDTRVLAQKQNVHEDTLEFVQASGEELKSITWSEGIINAEQAMLQMTSQSSLFNGGFPAGLAVVTGVLEMAKTGLEVRKQEVQTAQQMRFEQANAQIELIEGMGAIQKETIDLAQLGVDIQETVVAVHEARARAVNAVMQAKRIFQERGQSLAVSSLNPAHDPSFRIMRDSLALQLLSARAVAQRQLFLAGRALEYEVNTPIDGLAGAVLNARNSVSMPLFQSCLNQVYNSYRTAFGAEQPYPKTVSVRKMLGILGPRKDDVTGEVLSEGAQFRQILLKNENLDGRGGVGITFATNLQPGNGLWSTDVCADRISSVRAQLVGDFQGDNEAQVNLSMSGAAVMRSCGSSDLQIWALGSGSNSSGDAFAVIQAGVNTFGSAQGNTSLYGQSVARASWRLVIPGADAAPSNSDLDLTKLEDVALEIEHEARPRRDSPLSVDLSCLASVK